MKTRILYHNNLEIQRNTIISLDQELELLENKLSSEYETTKKQEITELVDTKIQERINHLEQQKIEAQGKIDEITQKIKDELTAIDCIVIENTNTGELQDNLTRVIVAIANKENSLSSEINPDDRSTLLLEIEQLKGQRSTIVGILDRIKEKEARIKKIKLLDGESRAFEGELANIELIKQNLNLGVEYEVNKQFKSLKTNLVDRKDEIIRSIDDALIHNAFQNCDVTGIPQGVGIKTVDISVNHFTSYLDENENPVCIDNRIINYPTQIQINTPIEFRIDFEDPNMPGMKTNIEIYDETERIWHNLDSVENNIISGVFSLEIEEGFQDPGNYKIIIPQMGKTLELEVIE